MKATSRPSNVKTDVKVEKPQPTVSQYVEYDKMAQAINSYQQAVSSLQAHFEFLRMSRDTDRINELATTLHSFLLQRRNEYIGALNHE